jgi:hypothetical protein
MPDWLPGMFLIVAGVGMIVLRRPLSLMQTAAIDLIPGKRDPK